MPSAGSMRTSAWVRCLDFDSGVPGELAQPIEEEAHKLESGVRSPSRSKTTSLSSKSWRATRRAAVAGGRPRLSFCSAPTRSRWIARAASGSTSSGRERTSTFGFDRLGPGGKRARAMGAARCSKAEPRRTQTRDHRRRRNGAAPAGELEPSLGNEHLDVPRSVFPGRRCRHDPETLFEVSRLANERVDFLVGARERAQRHAADGLATIDLAHGLRAEVRAQDRRSDAVFGLARPGAVFLLTAPASVELRPFEVSRRCCSSAVKVLR